MKNLRKLVIASFMLVIAFVAVVSSTYAWFTASSDATVKDIQIEVVDASNSLLVSTDGENWGKEIDVQFVGKFTPVTAVTGENGIEFRELRTDKNLKPYDVAATLLDKSGAANADTTKKGYLKFDLWIQLDAKDAATFDADKISIDLTNLHAFAAKSNNQFITDTTDENYKENAFAVSSFRIYFENQDVQGRNTMIEGQGTGTYGFGDQFDGNKNAWMSLYASPAHAAELAENHSDATEVSGKTYGPYVTAPESGSTYTLADQDPIHTGTVVNNTAADQFEKTIEKADFLAANITNNGASGRIHLVVYVWMEGWDGDNVNAASGCLYSFGLNLEVENPNA